MKPSDSSTTISLAGDTLHLLPQRAVWKPGTDELFVADTHFGKEAAFRHAAIPVPDSTEVELRRLRQIIEQVGCKRVVVLGDLIHNRRGVTQKLTEQFASWRRQWRRIEFTLIRGNHDRFAGDPPEQWKLQVLDPPGVSGGLKLLHEPDFNSRQPALAGHIHPKFRVRSGADELRLPCFALRKQTLVLPAFASFVDGLLLKKNSQRIFAIADDEVLEF